MDKLLIRGGRRLNGTVTISGAKNAALPDLCAALLSAEPMVLNNVPRLQDVATMRRLLDNMVENGFLKEQNRRLCIASDTVAGLLLAMEKYEHRALDKWH